MWAGLHLLLMHPLGVPALNQIAPFHGITPAPNAVTVTAIITAAVGVAIGVAVAVIMTHIIPEEAILTANATGATPGGDLTPMTHHDHDHPDDITTNHDPTEGINLTAEAGLDPWEDVIATDPVLQIVNVPGVPQSPLTGSDVEQVKTLVSSHESITDQVAKIVM